MNIARSNFLLYYSEPVFIIRGYLKNRENNSVSRLGSDRSEQTHEFIVKSNF
jgi:hypothetical protein